MELVEELHLTRSERRLEVSLIENCGELTCLDVDLTCGPVNAAGILSCWWRDCCLQYQALYLEGALVLYTDDKNLCSKALLSGVKALSKADLVKEVEGTRCTILNYIHAQPAVPPPAEPVVKEEKGSQKNKRSDEAEERLLSECVSLLPPGGAVRGAGGRNEGDLRRTVD